MSLHSHEHVGQVVDRVNAVLLARRDKRADDARFFGLTLDAVDLTDQIECFFGFRGFALLEQFPSCVRDAASAQSSARLRDGVVAGVHVDNETTFRVAKDLLRNGATAARRVAIDRFWAAAAAATCWT